MGFVLPGAEQGRVVILDNFEFKGLVRDALELKLYISDLFLADENVGHSSYSLFTIHDSLLIFPPLIILVFSCRFANSNPHCIRRRYET